MNINKDTKLFGSFSKSPGNKGAQFFNKAFHEHGVNAIYKAYYIEDIEQGVQAAKTLNFGGFAVAMPHKRDILPFLDEIDSIAQEIGTVNTVVNTGGIFKGFNTDYLGICEIFPILDLKDCVVVGDGGLAASVFFYLQKGMIAYKMITRVNWSELDSLKDCTVINCTPVSLSHIAKDNLVIDLRVGEVFGDLLHKYQAKEQFRLYTGLEYV